MKNIKSLLASRVDKNSLNLKRYKASLRKVYAAVLKNVSSVFKVSLGMSLLLPFFFALPVSAATAPVTSHPAPSLVSNVDTLTTGPDGNLWFDGDNAIGSMTASGVIAAEYPGTGSNNTGFAMDSDGTMWYVGIDPATGQHAIDSMTLSGTVTGYPLPADLNVDSQLTIGPDGNIWFSADEYDSNTGNQVYEIANITPNGTLTTYPLPSGIDASGAYIPIVVAHGSLWFAANSQSGGTDIIENITTSGAVTSYALPSGTQATSLATGSNGNLWFTTYDAAGNSSIDSMTADGTITAYALTSGVQAAGIIAGPGNNLWFQAYNSDGSEGIDSITTSGAVTSYALPSGTQATSLATGPNGNLWFYGSAGRIEELQNTRSLTPVQSINAGGSAGGGYDADTDFYGGSAYTSSTSVDITNAANPAPQYVYQSSRYGNSFSYTLANLTPGANYTLMLQFSEPYWGVGNNGGGIGSRVFNVAVNGTAALTNYDIYKTAGGANRAVAEEIPATADANGDVTIQFTSVTDNAIVSGIQLFNGTLSAQPPHQAYAFSSLINAGGSAAGDFTADSQFSGGVPYTSSTDVDTSGVANPAPESVFKSARYGTNFSYTIPDLAPNAAYNVRLDFNEPYFGVGNNGGGVGSRVFNVEINGTSELSNFDIYATAGGANKAVAKDFTVTSDAQGNVTIQFTSVSDNAIVSGVEVTQP
jgi:streptogramin lyase